MKNVRISSEPHASPEDAAVIRDGPALFNVAAPQPTYYSPLAIFLRDDRGALQPVRMDPDRNEGRYEDPNVWMRHPVRVMTYYGL
jgi:hypothetical protein